MSKDKSKTVPSIQYRQGEGYSVELTVTTSENGTSIAGLELGALPVPERRFVCDAASVVAGAGVVKFLFAQTQPVGDGLLSMLVITMTHESLSQFAKSISADFEKGLEEMPHLVTRPGLSVFREKAEQTVILNASYVIAGYAGSDACLDLFYSSPFAVRQVAFFKKLSVEPIVRISLPTGLLLDILDKVREMAGATSAPKALENPK